MPPVIDWSASIADVTARIAAAKANGDNDPKNKLVDMEASLEWYERQQALQGN